MGQKDMEISQAIQEASEVAQRDERQIIGEYDQQIVELQKELRLRERDMLALQKETEDQLDVMRGEREEVRVFSIFVYYYYDVPPSSF